MCRHLAYLGPMTALGAVIVDPPHSLHRQSWAPRLQRHGTVNADGFGVGWYPAGPQEPPARYRRAVPIWADPNLPDLARSIHSGAVLAAVRSATAGTSQDETAAAPFLDGSWLFSHNGAVPGWTDLPAALGPEADLDATDLLRLEARSDSALLWAMVARRLRRSEAPGTALAAVLTQVVAARPEARLNLLLTDGTAVAATRHGDTLWYRVAEHSVVVASEPDGEGEWREVPEHTLLLGTGTDVRITPLHTAITLAHSAAAEDQDAMTSRFTIDHRLPAGYFDAALRADVSAGLAAPPRTLPPKWFYDARGSQLFEEITRLPEYYVTGAEQEILTERAPEIAALTGAHALIELGSGSSRKTRLLLDAITATGTLRRYAPLDVSSSALVEAGRDLCREYPTLRVAATVTDFERDLPGDVGDEGGPRLLAFLGSTIGNFDTGQRQAFYAAVRRALRPGDALLLGADLVKSPAVLLPAYDDSRGVTAAFNKNVLHVLNRELDADFDPDAFDHVAVWNAEEERVEMRLRSRAEQTIKIRGLDLSVDFAHGEEMRTEISCKFRRESLTAELATGGFTVRRWWTDSAGRFALLLAEPVR